MIMHGIMHSLAGYDVKQVAQPTSGGLGYLSGAIAWRCSCLGSLCSVLVTARLFDGARIICG
jgi:hypothetical protein